MKLRIILLFAILNGSVTFAQPGYMGKKIAVGYAFEFTPYLPLLTKLDEPEILTFMKGHNINLGYTINRKAEIFLNLSTRPREFYMQSLGYNYDYILADESRIKGSESFVDVGWRKYSTDFIAPVGMYFQYSFGFGKVGYDPDIKNIPATVYTDDGWGSHYVHLVLPNTNTTISTKRLGLAFGLKSALKGAIYFSTEVGLYAYFSDVKRVKNTDYLTGDYTTYYLRDNLMLNHQAYRGYYLKFGIGKLF